MGIQPSEIIIMNSKKSDFNQRIQFPDINSVLMDSIYHFFLIGVQEWAVL